MRITWILPHLENDDALAHTDLWSGDSRPAQGAHRLVHVSNEGLKLVIKPNHGHRHLPQHRMPHFQYGSNRHGPMLPHQNVIGRARNSSVPSSISNPNPSPRLA